MKSVITSNILKILIMFCIFATKSYSTPIQHTINSNWKFHKGNLDEKINNINTDKWESVSIPHTWNQKDAEDEKYGWYRGIGWYEKKININKKAGQQIFIHFEAANLVTEVWINGISAGDKHIGGYTPFVYNITSLINEGENQILIKVDNSHNENINPLSADFTFYGGVYRDISLIYKDNAYFNLYEGNGVFINTENVSTDNATVKIRSLFIKEDNKKYTFKHLILDDEGKIIAETKNKKLTQKEDLTKINIKYPCLWDTSNPYLYTVVSQLLDEEGVIVDEVRNPLGIRFFHFDPQKGFFLNGKHLKLIGVNRHQDYKGYGNAISDDMHRYDMKLMKDLGINCFRISHYPQDPAILEYCDKYGFICFEEIPIVNRINTTNEFVDNCKRQIKEMISRDYNHPCIVAWNSSNEITVPHPNKKNWTKEQNEFYKNYLKNFLEELQKYIKQLDSSRTSMIVHCYTPEENVQQGFHQGELIGYNKYLGWYEGKINDIYKFFNDFKKVEPDKSLFMSEFGAGSDIRIHTFNPHRFDHSEEYHILYLKEHLKAIMNTEHVAGGTIWAMVDFNSEFRNDAIPHINEKGLLTADRKPKASYYYYKTVLSKNPYISIPTKQWIKRGGIADVTNNGTCTQKVEVFANTPEVELFINGISLGKKKVEEYSAVFDVPFVDGKNLLELNSQYNNKLLKDFMEIDFEMLPNNLQDNQCIDFNEISINNGSYCYVNDNDENSHLWYPDKPYSKGSWGYVGGTYFKREADIYGTNINIQGTNLNPVFQTQIVGINEYRFDVKDGLYELTLSFAELQRKADRIFSVKVNGETIIKDLDIKGTYGLFNAVKERFNVTCKNNEGIKIEFVSHKGESILNGISLRKVY